MPVTGIEATREALDVEVRTDTYTYTTTTKVGEVVNRDSYGNVVGTAEIYENRTGFYNVMRWQAFQGEMPIDDEDLYRIAGDNAIADKIRESRESGVSLNKIGIGMMIGGGALAIASVLLIPAFTTKDAYGVEKAPTWFPYAMGAGGLTVSIGSVLTFVGLAKARRQHPIDDPSLAYAVARRYNKSLGIESKREVQRQENERRRAIPPRKKGLLDVVEDE